MNFFSVSIKNNDKEEFQQSLPLQQELPEEETVHPQQNERMDKGLFNTNLEKGYMFAMFTENRYKHI